MTDVQHAHEWYETESSFGMHALGVLIEVSEEAPQRADGERRWFVSDHRSLVASMRFEDDIRSGRIPKDAPEDVLTPLAEYVDSWHGALPFSEAERAIVCSAYKQEARPVPMAYREVPGRLRKQEFEIVSSGVRNVVRGRDLMHRWWSWRRELDEFADQGSLAMSKQVLLQLAGQLIAPEKMPDIYYDLQEAKRPVAYERDW